MFGTSVAAFLRNCAKAVLGVFRVGILWKRKAYTGSLEKEDEKQNTTEIGDVCGENW